MAVIFITNFQFTLSACTVSTSVVKVMFLGNSYLAYQLLSYFLRHTVLKITFVRLLLILNLEQEMFTNSPFPLTLFKKKNSP